MSLVAPGEFAARRGHVASFGVQTLETLERDRANILVNTVDRLPRSETTVRNQVV
jgi:hypothetical protein